MAERYDGYLETLVEHGICPDPTLFFEATDNLESGVAGLAAKIARGELPASAIVAGTDRNAIGIMQAAQAAGYDVPGDLAVVGFDDIDVAVFPTPSLSSVRQLLDTMAESAVHLLLRRVAIRRHRIPTSFVARARAAAATPVRTSPPALRAVRGPTWRTSWPLCCRRISGAGRGRGPRGQSGRRRGRARRQRGKWCAERRCPTR